MTERREIQVQQGNTRAAEKERMRNTSTRMIKKTRKGRGGRATKKVANPTQNCAVEMSVRGECKSPR
jgi:hypothetical protein